VSHTEAELMGVKNFGATSLVEVREKLTELGLTLRILEEGEEPPMRSFGFAQGDDAVDDDDDLDDSPGSSAMIGGPTADTAPTTTPEAESPDANPAPASGEDPEKPLDG
jgi:hypothetical protein